MAYNGNLPADDGYLSEFPAQQRENQRALKEDKIAKIGQENCFIPSRYIEIVKEGVKNFSKEFQDNFEDIFSNFPFEIKEGIYTFSDPIQNQAAKNSKRLS